MPRTLVYDGDCGFCRLWVGYWQALTGDSVEYVPYQSDAQRFPEVPSEDFRKAVQLFEDGRRYSGAEAVFRLKGGFWPRIYALLPGFFEFLYRLVAANRNPGYKVTRLLWGNHVKPSTYERASSLFARAIALIYMIAFISIARQLIPLIGDKGIEPLMDFLPLVDRQFGSGSIFVAPTLFWWINSDFAFQFLGYGGAVLAFVTAIGRPHTGGQKAAFVVLFIYYLSIVTGGQLFTSFQWDFLLLEAGFLTIFLKPFSRARIFLFQFLLARLMFQSGVAKLVSHDPSWRNLTALSYHYWTQPLPTPVAWYMAQLPMWFQKASVLFMFVVELVLPFLMFGPRRLKQVAAFGTIALQLMIILTGNYNFFNLLTIVLCLFLFDDAFLPAAQLPKSAKLLSRRGAPPKVPRSNRYVTAALVVSILTLSLSQVGKMLGIQAPEPVAYLASHASNLGIVNSYGLFAVMTTSRPEISIEGSNDALDWQPYTFKYKPGPLNRPPVWVAPDQPRLDWQMWFAALGNWRENPWLVRFMTRLLQGDQPVLELMEHNPFPDKPPRFMRAMVYDYRFTSYDERRQTGNWWKRELKGVYFPPITLRAPNEKPDKETTIQ
ncbi:MAG TPA: lipase maturation factor family protein [Bryobacteraceae bacterium]|nr:lipase maturation factor family protein [Bryobacteraceae bacterium]